MPCDRCGSCCTQVNFKFIDPPPGDDIELWWRLHHLYITHDRGRVFVGMPSVCHWYDPAAGACTHYDERPGVCRAFTCPKCDMEAGPA